MIIAHCDSDVTEYMTIITATELENPVLIDKYLMGTEVEVDAICDGTDFLIPGIMEHIERAGVHSGDSISVYPAQTLSDKIKSTIVTYTERLAKALNVIGLVNIQYVVYNNEVYVIEVNPRSSRTVPYISKVTGVQMVDIATKIMLGETLKEQGYHSGLYPVGNYVAVKVPVFSFEKLHDVDTQLGPEMKSTGEALGIAKTFEEALYKGLIAAGFKIFKKGGVMFTVKNSDKPEIVPLAEKFEKLGFELIACFDCNEEKVGKKLNNLTIMHDSLLDEFCQNNKINTAFLCIPRVCVENVLDKLYGYGIKNYWNFSHYDIARKYSDTLVENVHLSDSLMTLCYKMNNRDKIL